MRCLQRVICIVVIFILSVIQPIRIQAMEQNIGSKIIINLPSCTLGYYENNKLIKEYSIAIGKQSTPTPLGLFTIIDKDVNPCWYPPDKKGYVVTSGPDNPLGYRWMGFGGNYGIHGTNAPWSIGSAVSNGCIRMHEDDVEDLFDKTPYDTPVHITYERIKVQINQMGQASIGIYSDVYQRGSVTLEQVKHKLVTEGLGNVVEDDFLSQLITEEKGTQVLFAKLYNMKINNKNMPPYLVSWDEVIYAPVLAIASHLDTNVTWDEQRQLVVGKQYAVPGVIKKGILYVAAKDLPTLFGVRQSWDEENRCLLINAPELRMAGQAVTCNVQQINNINYVPIITVAKVLDKKLSWEAKNNTLWLGSRKLSVTMLADEPYIEASKISDYFNTRVMWDEKSQVLNLNDSCCAMDYSMYLGEMGDFMN